MAKGVKYYLYEMKIDGQMKESIKNLERHLELSGGDAIRAICKPLRDYLNINSLVYKRLNADGTELNLSTHPHWLETWYSNKLFQNSVLEKEPENYVSGQILWSQISTHQEILSAAYQQDIAHGLTLIRPDENACDFYYFGAHNNNEQLGQLLMNNLDLLDQFILHFKAQAADLIKTGKKYPIKIPNKSFLNKHSVKDIPQYQNQSMRNQFLNELFKKGIVLNVDDEMITLTKKEVSVARQLVSGKTMREIADELFISPRTVETHIYHLKIKFDVNKKSDLIKKLSLHLFNKI